MNELTEFVYLTRDNTIDLELRENGIPVNLTGLTRARLELRSVDDPTGAVAVFDSDVTPTLFDWVTLGASGVLIINLGGTALVQGDYLARLVVYDGASPAGLVWTHETTTGCLGTRLIVRALDTADAA